MIRVLLFTRDEQLPALLAAAFGEGYRVTAEPHADSIPTRLQKDTFDVVLLDIDTENRTTEHCVEILDGIDNTGVTAVAMVNDTGRAVAMELLDRGVHAYCRKPPAMRELKAIVRRACEFTLMKRELSAHQQGPRRPAVEQQPFACDALIGSSPPMLRVYDLIHRVAALNASILITGESGTGKELIARAIHNLGPRKTQPFVAVSCGAIPETLMESELFGHKKGSFTGSIGTHIGYFEQAGTGTLFLDEIGELSAPTQVKLLRVLQEREFCRVGSSSPIPLKARVIFATHRNLPRMIEEGRFRLDLYYRMNVMTIHAPSLAERPEDIDALVQHLVRHYGQLYGKHVTGLSSDVLAVLMEYDWPGNVRELENAIQSAIIRADSNEIQITDLPPHISPELAIASIDEVTPAGKFERLIRDYKVKLMLKAIEECHGNKTLAARSLDISRAYLHRLIRPSDVQTGDAA